MLRNLLYSTSKNFTKRCSDNQILKKFSGSNKNIKTQQEEQENLIFKKYNAMFKLNNRSVVSVTGADAEPFLQSMMTNDIRKLKDELVAIFNLFLNPKGKIMFDSIVVKSHFSDQKYPDYWIDIHEDDKEEFIKHLTSHCIRKKVQIQDMTGFLSVHGAVSLLVGAGPKQVEEGHIWKQLQDTAEYTPSEDNPEIMVTDSMSFYDPRLRSLGCRIICPPESLDIETDCINLKITYDDFEAIRLLYGVLEGSKQVKDGFPLNLNFHHLNGISFNKGCYIGQELTQRTYHTGVIRKHAMPFILTDKLKFRIGNEEDSSFQGHIIIPYQSIDKKFSSDLKNKNILDGCGVVIGTVIVSKYNCGIAMIEKEKLENATIAKFTIEGMNTIIYDPISLWESIKELHHEDNHQLS